MANPDLRPGILGANVTAEQAGENRVNVGLSLPNTYFAEISEAADRRGVTVESIIKRGIGMELFVADHLAAGETICILDKRGVTREMVFPSLPTPHRE